MGFVAYTSPPDVTQKTLQTLLFSLSIGWVTEDTEGRVSVLPVFLRSPAIQGMSYTLTNKLGLPVTITAAANTSTGFVNMPIEPQTVDVLADEYVLFTADYLNTVLQNDPGRIAEGAIFQQEVQSLGKLATTYDSGTSYSTISLSNVDSVIELRDAQTLTIIRNAGWTGTNRTQAAQENVVVNGDQTITPSGGLASVAIVPKVFALSHTPTLSFLIKPAYTFVTDLNETNVALEAADELLSSSQRFGSTIEFSSSGRNNVEWTAGDIVLQNGDSYAISSGSVTSLTNNDYRYFYYDIGGSTLSLTTTIATATQTGNILIAVARRGADTDQRAWIVPAVGKLLLNNENLAVNSVKANNIAVNSLSAVSANMGTLTAGTIQVAGTGGTIWLNPSSSIAIAAGNDLASNAPFRVTYAGAFTATNATITGAITASSGSLNNLSVVGTLTMSSSGVITNGSGNYVIDEDGIRINPSGSNQDVFIYNGGIILAGGSDVTDSGKMITFGDGANSGQIYYGTNIYTGASSAFFITTSAGTDIHISPGAGTTSTTGNVIISLYDTPIGGNPSYVDINGGYITIDHDQAGTSSSTGAIRVTHGGIGVALASYFGSTVVVGNASSDTHALNRGTANGLYGRLATQSTYTADQIFEAAKLKVKATSNTGLVSVEYANTATNRFVTIPSLGGNRTFAFIDQAQGWNAVQTIAFGNLALRNTEGNGSATLNYGVAGADRTYTFSGSNGTVLTTANYTSTLNSVYGRLGSSNNWTNTNTFNSTITVPNASSDTHALNRVTADGRFVRVGNNNNWTGTQLFSNAQFSLTGLPTSSPGTPGRVWIEIVGPGENYLRIDQ